MQQGVTLDTIGGGALAELFAVELGRVLENIADINTDEKAKRSISITVTFKPEDRGVAGVELTCSSKLSGIRKVKTQLFMGMQRGKLIAVENDPRQSKLFDEPPALKPAAVAHFSPAERT